MDNLEPVKQSAAILHTDLTSDIIEFITRTLAERNSTVDILTPDKLGDFDSHVGPLRDIFAKYNSLIFDGLIDGRPGLEYVLFCKSFPETTNIPITLLHSGEQNGFMVTVYTKAGVKHLAKKDDLRHSGAFRSYGASWEKLNSQAKKIVHNSETEAAALGENNISTEHILLGLLRERECTGARILSEKCGVLLDEIENDTRKQLDHGPGRSETSLGLTLGAKNVIDFGAYVATDLNSDNVGSEHLLLGLIRERDRMAGRILASFGIELDSVYDIVRELPIVSNRSETC